MQNSDPRAAAVVPTGSERDLCADCLSAAPFLCRAGAFNNAARRPILIALQGADLFTQPHENSRHRDPTLICSSKNSRFVLDIRLENPIRNRHESIVAGPLVAPEQIPSFSLTLTRTMRSTQTRHGIQGGNKKQRIPLPKGSQLRANLREKSSS